MKALNELVGLFLLVLFHSGISLCDIDTTAINITVEEGQYIEIIRTLTNNNASPGRTLNYTITDDMSWFSVSPESGNLTQGQSESITFYLNNTALTVGTYTGTITITGDSNTDNSPQTISVTLTILENGSLNDGLLPYYLAASRTSQLVDSRWYLNAGKKHAFAVYRDFDSIVPRKWRQV